MAEGTVASVQTGGFILSPEAGTTPCGVVSDLVVSLTDDVTITTVSITDDTADVMPDGVLEAGQSVGLNGVCEAGGLTADKLVIVDDQRL
ncbi:MAG: hypothetical protein KZQ66_00400 [Candidatus Thiodiazotropha sp. (ex Lucinoma aequizonata)]|nr:hypothetical protein [Candidatus Thiodiazotropha sp. (ex Lucinoma aequizonata)]MCU7888474.1 hypothetical protein [Candidatus Thiodiazotropha sp. (ex Lucinoma aequizonata)]MCU7894306.1 hypothetical protein [Candidatus Thiodiazotropha sp. (ex Lucinoma aequizonata)]MCU7899968.1 hypothetical protein [Candidatus Thiodiazotropha sp. (ex Lucinoma aequizonata)]MCU7900662.1 hypothetical protein [Candidatus Thiodiazotropha sp. (ex Lucinoma aequizonata)]